MNELMIATIWIVILIFFLIDELRRARKWEREMSELYSKVFNLNTELKDRNKELERKVNYYESIIRTDNGSRP